MHRAHLNRYLAAGLATLLAVTALPVGADGGTGDKGTDMAIDLVALRPMGLVATGIGAMVFVVGLPFTWPSGKVRESACELVSRPAAYTFTRPLGELDERTTCDAH